MIRRLTDYLKSSWAELKHVNWPTRRETIRFTLIVIAVSLAVAVFLGLLDLLFSYLLESFVL